jgi:hypothetical protein
MHTGFRRERHTVAARFGKDRQSLGAGEVHDVNRRLIFVCQPDQQLDGIDLGIIGTRG